MKLDDSTWLKNRLNINNALFTMAGWSGSNLNNQTKNRDTNFTLYLL